jgi:hypothetical protein
MKPILLGNKLAWTVLIVFGMSARLLWAGAGSEAGISETALWPGSSWTIAETPEEFGWSSEKLERAALFSKKIGIWMILDASGVADIGENPSLHVARGPLSECDSLAETMADLGVQVTVPSRLIEGGDRTFTARFSRDGSMVWIPKGEETIVGKWKIENHKCCVDIDDFTGCFSVIREGDVLKFYDATDTLFIAARIIE